MSNSNNRERAERRPSRDPFASKKKPKDTSPASDVTANGISVPINSGADDVAMSAYWPRMVSSASPLDLTTDEVTVGLPTVTSAVEPSNPLRGFRSKDNPRTSIRSVLRAADARAVEPVDPEEIYGRTADAVRRLSKRLNFRDVYAVDDFLLTHYGTVSGYDHPMEMHELVEKVFGGVFPPIDVRIGEAVSVMRNKRVKNLSVPNYQRQYSDAIIAAGKTPEQLTDDDRRAILHLLCDYHGYDYDQLSNPDGYEEFYRLAFNTPKPNASDVIGLTRNIATDITGNYFGGGPAVDTTPAAIVVDAADGLADPDAATAPDPLDYPDHVGYINAKRIYERVSLPTQTTHHVLNTAATVVNGELAGVLTLASGTEKASRLGAKAGKETVKLGWRHKIWSGAMLGIIGYGVVANMGVLPDPLGQPAEHAGDFSRGTAAHVVDFSASTASRVGDIPPVSAVIDIAGGGESVQSTPASSTVSNKEFANTQPDGELGDDAPLQGNDEDEEVLTAVPQFSNQLTVEKAGQYVGIGDGKNDGVVTVEIKGQGHTFNQDLNDQLAKVGMGSEDGGQQWRNTLAASGGDGEKYHWVMPGQRIDVDQTLLAKDFQKTGVTLDQEKLKMIGVVPTSTRTSVTLPASSDANPDVVAIPRNPDGGDVSGATGNGLAQARNEAKNGGTGSVDSTAKVTLTEAEKQNALTVVGLRQLDDRALTQVTLSKQTDPGNGEIMHLGSLAIVKIIEEEQAKAPVTFIEGKEDGKTVYTIKTHNGDYKVRPVYEPVPHIVSPDELSSTLRTTPTPRTTVTPQPTARPTATPTAVIAAILGNKNNDDDEDELPFGWSWAEWAAMVLAPTAAFLGTTGVLALFNRKKKRKVAAAGVTI